MQPLIADVSARPAKLHSIRRSMFAFLVKRSRGAISYWPAKTWLAHVVRELIRPRLTILRTFLHCSKLRKILLKLERGAAISDVPTIAIAR